MREDSIASWSGDMRARLIFSSGSLRYRAEPEKDKKKASRSGAASTFPRKVDS